MSMLIVGMIIFKRKNNNSNDKKKKKKKKLFLYKNFILNLFKYLFIKNIFKTN